jgi:hypothetical protein
MRRREADEAGIEGKLAGECEAVWIRCQGRGASCVRTGSAVESTGQAVAPEEREGDITGSSDRQAGGRSRTVGRGQRRPDSPIRHTLCFRIVLRPSQISCKWAAMRMHGGCPVLALSGGCKISRQLADKIELDSAPPSSGRGSLTMMARPELSEWLNGLAARRPSLATLESR